jgi:hypothetical protein
MRNLPITYNLVALTVFSLVVVVGGLLGVTLLIFQDRRAFFTSDAVLVISMRVAELHQNGPFPTPAQVDDGIRELIQASVIHGGVDAQKRPVDVYGTPYRVRHTAEGALHRVTATSAGPDRQFDTPDDISREATWETLTPEKR